MSKYLFIDDMLINVLLKEQKPSGGAAVQTYAWIRGLMKEGQDVVCMTNLSEFDTIKEENKDIKLIPFYNASFGLRWLRWIYYRIPFLYNSIKKTKPVFIIQGVPDWTTCIYAVISKILNKHFIIRVACDCFVDDRIYIYHSRLSKVLMYIGFSLSDTIMCQNNYQLKNLTEKYPEKNILKYGNPFFNIDKISITSSDSRQYISWVGLFQYQKNMKLLFEIALSLKNESFKIVGEEYSAEIDDESKLYVTKLKKLNNVEFVGFLSRKQVIKLLKESKFLLNTSFFEGFSNTYLESMSCGTPIIATENANPDSIITKFNLGFVYKDITEIDDFLKHQNTDEYIKMSQSVIDYVNEKHNYRKLSRDLIKQI